jgi:hypothetical protein
VDRQERQSHRENDEAGGSEKSRSRRSSLSLKPEYAPHEKLWLVIYGSKAGSQLGSPFELSDKLLRRVIRASNFEFPSRDLAPLHPACAAFSLDGSIVQGPLKRFVTRVCAIARPC